MALQAFPWALQGQSHDATTARAGIAAMFGAPAAALTAGVQVTTAGGAHGVVGDADMAVTQNGTPNMSVNVALGRAVVRAGNASSLSAGAWTHFNDATVNVPISAADPTNPRIDLIVLEARSAVEYGDAANDNRFTVVQGTPGAVPAVPSVANRNVLVLAQVAVGAAVASILTANITDKRTFVAAIGGKQRCVSTARPTGVSLYKGLTIVEIDTLRELRYDGTGFICMAEPAQSFTSTLTNFTVSSQSGSFHRSDGWCDFVLSGTLNAAATGAMQITTPVQPHPTTARSAFAGVYVSAGVQTYLGTSEAPSGSTITLLYPTVTGALLAYNQCNATQPFTWKNTDTFSIAGRFRMNTPYL